MNKRKLLAKQGRAKKEQIQPLSKDLQDKIRSVFDHESDANFAKTPIGKTAKLDKTDKVNTVQHSLFDESDISDLPQELQNDIAKNGRNISANDKNSASYKILSLFDIQSPLTFSGIMIGLYRQYKNYYPRKLLYGKLHYLKRIGYLRFCGKGLWAKEENKS